MQHFKSEKEYYTDDFHGVPDKCLQYRFLIPQSAAGAIISRKGEAINRMRAQYKCDISVPDSRGAERLLLINADIERLCLIMAEIFDLVKDCMHSKVNDPKDISRGSLPDNVISDEMDLRFLVSENVCGAIIGKGGEVIRRLTDTYRVSVFKVYQQMCPASTDRVIRLVGLPEDILSCLRGIHEVILGLKDIKSAREYDPNDCNELHAVNYGGWMTPETRRSLARSGKPPSATKGFTPSGRSRNSSQGLSGGGSCNTSAVVMEGLSLSQMSDKLRSRNIMMDITQENNNNNNQYHGFQGQNSRVPQRAPPPSSIGPSELSRVSLPNKLIGAIMGKGGCRINDIREESGARIDVDKTDSEERVITIQGTREQIERAQCLLQQCVRKYGGKQ